MCRQGPCGLVRALEPWEGWIHPGFKTSALGGLDGWAWNEVKALPLLWFSGLAIILKMVDHTGVWPQGLLDAFLP